MTPLVVRIDGILPVEPEDVAVLVDAGIRYEEATCRTEDEVIAAARGAAGLLIVAEPITARVLDALPDLRVVGRFGVGLDTIDMVAATARGVTVVNVPDENSTEVAAHAVSLILTLCRRLPQLNASVQSGAWSFRDGGADVRRLSEMTVGIVGFGRIGRLVAAPLQTLGFGILVSDPFVDSAVIESAGYEAADLDDLVERSDVVSLHVPLVEQTRDLLNAERIARLRPGAIVVNVSRGGLVDEEALAAAVGSGALAGAGIDTVAVEPLPADSPLRGHTNIVLTPHAAHYSVESLRMTVHRAFEDVARVVLGQAPRNPAN